MKNLLSIIFILLQAVSAFSQTQVGQKSSGPDNAFMAYNHYPQYTLGLTKAEMLRRYPDFKEMKKQEILVDKKYSSRIPSFSLKNNKVYGYSGFLYQSYRLSTTDSPTKTKLLCEKHVKSLTEIFQFEPKVEEQSDNSTSMPLTSTTYTWEKNNKKFMLTEVSSFDVDKVYYGYISINSVDENLAQ